MNRFVKKEESIQVFLRELRGFDWHVQDHWEGDCSAIGLMGTRPDRLAYVSALSDPPGRYYVELEAGEVLTTDYTVTATLEISTLTEAVAAVKHHLTS